MKQTNGILNKEIKILKWGWYKLLKCILGIFVFSLAINLFIVPNNFYTGGILGFAQLIRSAIVLFLSTQKSWTEK